MDVKYFAIFISFIFFICLDSTSATRQPFVYLCDNVGQLTCYVGEIAEIARKLKQHCIRKESSEVSSLNTNISMELSEAFEHQEAAPPLAMSEMSRHGSLKEIFDLLQNCFYAEYGGKICDAETEITFENFVYHHSKGDGQHEVHIDGWSSSVELKQLNDSVPYRMNDETVGNLPSNLHIYKNLWNLQLNTDRNFTFIYLGDAEDSLTCSERDNLEHSANQSPMTAGVIAGVVLASLVLIVLVVLLIFLCLKRGSLTHDAENVTSKDERTFAVNSEYDYINQDEVSDHVKTDLGRGAPQDSQTRGSPQQVMVLPSYSEIPHNENGAGYVDYETNTSSSPPAADLDLSPNVHNRDLDKPTSVPTYSQPIKRQQINK